MSTEIEEAKRRVEECKSKRSETLCLIGLGLTSLKGLEIEKLSHLTDLALSYNQIQDISCLKGLITLKELTLTNNQIQDLSPLSSLTNLKELGLADNQIVDLTPLSGLSKLKVLDLASNQIQDISSLKGLTDLEELDLANNKIVDISYLSILTNLEELDLNNNKIKSIGCLPSSVNPEVFKYTNNPLEEGGVTKESKKEFVVLKVGGVTKGCFRPETLARFKLFPSLGGRCTLSLYFHVGGCENYSGFTSEIEEVLSDLMRQLGVI